MHAFTQKGPERGGVATPTAKAAAEITARMIEVKKPRRDEELLKEAGASGIALECAMTSLSWPSLRTRFAAFRPAVGFYT
jgi:hypothetical protein